MLEFEVLVQGCFQPHEVEINYDPTLTMPGTETDRQWMDTFWHTKLDQAQKKHIPLFDAPLFRLIQAASNEQKRLRIILGNTSYKEYVTTRDPAFATTHQRTELSNAIGVCSVVETTDGFILLDQRRGVDVYVGRYHVIGGFFERHKDVDIQQQQPDPFSAVQREITEETGILPDDITSQSCLGVVYDLATPHAEIIFQTFLNIPLATVLTRTPEDNEIQQIIPLHVDEISLRTFILQHHPNISATGEPNLLFYGGYKFGEEWLRETLAQLQTPV